MPQVPYQPFATANPTSRPTPDININTPLAAFGGTVGAAVEGLGNAISGAGDKIFTEAMRIQTLNNEAEAKEADANYMIAVGQKHAEYSSLQGKAAVDGLPGYMDDLKNTRTKMRDGLSNDMARKMFDSASLSTMGRTIFNGAGHAATQQKSWALNSSASRVDAMRDQALSMPNDDVAFQRSVNATRDEIDSQGKLASWDPDTLEQNKAKAESTLWTKRIEGIAKTNPYTANDLLDKAVKDGNIRGADIAPISNQVRQAMYIVGARKTSIEVNSGSGLQFGATPVDIKRAGAAIKEYESGGNYEQLGPEVPGRGRALGAYQVMPENLSGWLKQSGLPQITPAEFLKDHNAQDQVFATVFGGYMKQHGSFNDAASMWFTGRPMSKAGNADDGYHTTGQYLKATNASLARTASLEEKISVGRQVASDAAPNDPMYQDVVADRIRTDQSKIAADRRDAEYHDRNTIDSVFVGGGINGALPTTVDDLKNASPEAEAAWNRLDDTKRKQYMASLAKNAKGDVAWSQDRLRDYQRLIGMRQSDPVAFLDTDVIGSDLPMSAKKELVKLQQATKNQAEGDPRVTRALGILGPDLQAAGIDKTKANKDDYYQFVGALTDALEQWQTDNKKSPPPEEVRKIGARLLQQQHSDQFWFSGSTDKMYKLPMPSDLMQKVKDQAKAQGLPEPDDASIQREYTSQQYKKLYGGSKPSVSSGSTSASAGPQVPISQ